jgi:hypothetical protein
MPRTNKKDLQFRVDNLCKMTGRKFYLQGAYGGWQLMEDAGLQGCHALTPGFVSKPKLEDRLNAILTGVIIGERMIREKMDAEREKVYG